MGILGDAIGGLVGGIGDIAGKAADVATGGIGGIVGGMLKMISPQVDGVMGQFTQAQSMINDLVKTPMNEMLKQVDGGDIWRGPGADTFKQDLTSSFLPEVGMMDSVIQGMGAWMKNSKDAIEQADDDALKEVESLLDFFGV